MNNLNYDCFSVIFNFLSDKENLKIALLSKKNNCILKNKGFLKTLYINKNYPSKKYEDSIDLSKRLIMHQRFAETIFINYIDDPCPWMFIWTKNVFFSGCFFKNGVVDPLRKVNTEFISIKCNKHNCNNIKINYENFPNLKHVIINY